MYPENIPQNNYKLFENETSCQKKEDFPAVHTLTSPPGRKTMLP
jgi:hypothetical protein